MNVQIHKHQIGLIALTAIGIGTMIGSGWLFSAYYAAQIAGPAAYLAWFVTAFIILILGLSLAEIAFHYPKRGLMARLLVISHNEEFAFICTIATWLGLTAVIATEAEGSIQYLSSLSPFISHYLYNAAHQHLTTIGLWLSIAMVMGFGVINFWGIKLLSHSSTALTTAKILIPVITAIFIIGASFHSVNFVEKHNGLMPYGFSSILTAMIGAGMIYSFNGFQNIVSFSSEAKKPKRDIPLAMVLSVLITLLVYVVLQTAFIGALPTHSLIDGWRHIDFTSPFVQITAMLNLNLISIILYADAVISPSGTGLIYTGSTTRMLTGMAEDRHMPAFFKKLCAYNFSRRSLIATILLAILFLCFFRSWASLVSFLSLFYVISYMSIPLCLGKLRKHKIKGRFSLPLIQILLPLMFMFLSTLFIFAKAPFTLYAAGFIALAFGAYLLTQAVQKKLTCKMLLRACPLLVYLAFLALVSWMGPTAYGGCNWLNPVSFFGLILAGAFVMYAFSVYVYPSTPEKPKA